MTTFNSFDNGVRFCTGHSETVAIFGGAFVKSANGLTRQWLCKACLDRRAARIIAKRIANGA